jgi:predicted transcriptional regulator of viral defense system
VDKTDQILKFTKEKGIVRPKDVEELGIKRHILYSLYKKGLLIKIARGMYILPNAPITEYQNLIKVAKKIPSAVVCLISALSFHEITTQIPNELWVAVPRDTWRPKIDYPPLHYTVMNKKTYSFGIQEVDINGVLVKVYTPAKTVADCFKFRNKVGLDVAIEALREVLKTRKATINELVEAAKINRVLKIMRPYLEAIV